MKLFSSDRIYYGGIAESQVLGGREKSRPYYGH